jgi:anti-anti-sigma factor
MAEREDPVAAEATGAAWLRVAGPVSVVVLAGEHDVATIETVDRTFAAAEARGPEMLAVDLGQATFIDSTVLRAILDAHRRAARANWRFVLIAPPTTSTIVWRLLEISELTHCLEVWDTVADARAALHTGRAEV